MAGRKKEQAAATSTSTGSDSDSDVSRTLFKRSRVTRPVEALPMEPMTPYCGRQGQLLTEPKRRKYWSEEETHLVRLMQGYKTLNFSCLKAKDISDHGNG
jgi:hypothetical protein